MPTPAQAWSAVHDPASKSWQFELGPLPAAVAAHLPAEARSWRAFDRAEFFPASSESIPFGAPVTDLAIRADSSNFTIAATPAVGPRTGSTRRLPSGVLVLRGPDGLELALALLPPAPTPPDTGSR